MFSSVVRVVRTGVWPKRRVASALERRFSSGAGRRTLALDVHDAPPVTTLASKSANLRDLMFNLKEVAGVEELLEREKFQHVEMGEAGGDVLALLQLAVRIADEQFAPHAAASDANEPCLDPSTGAVHIVDGVKEALGAFSAAGMMGAGFSAELGGSQMPYCVGLAAFCPFNGANVPTASYAFLTIAAANLLARYGNAEQRARYLPGMLSGRFFGTMNLTEPQAGSSLGDIQTTATPLEESSDGAPGKEYLISGTKMFISGGQHDLSDSIVHLVLARVAGAPAGVKGLSLFVVPRHHIDADGNVGDPNDVTCAGLNHKMGWRGTVNTMMSYGENGRCVGTLVGEEGEGLKIMFAMMNEARVNIGVCAVMLGYAGYAHSLAYACERRQGRTPGDRDPTVTAVPIVKHPDVRRMLLTQKAFVEGGLALCIYAARLVDDVETAASQAERQEAALLLEVLTPIVKAWPSEHCLEANKWAIQVLGGYGYTRDFPVERFYRDNRLNKIHEGTDGIQALDLLGRKVGMAGGKGLKLLLREVARTLEEVKDIDDAVDGVFPDRLRLAGELDTLQRDLLATTEQLLGVGVSGDADLMLADAHEYLLMAGHTTVAWLWLKQAARAAELLARGGAAVPEEQALFYKGKVAACAHFFRLEVPRARLAGEVLRRMDDTLLTVEEGSL